MNPIFCDIKLSSRCVLLHCSVLLGIPQEWAATSCGSSNHAIIVIFYVALWKVFFGNVFKEVAALGVLLVAINSVGLCLELAEFGIYLLRFD